VYDSNVELNTFQMYCKYI